MTKYDIETIEFYVKKKSESNLHYTRRITAERGDE